MNPSAPGSAPHQGGRSDLGRLTLTGTTRVLLAEALIVPTGLATVAFLSRRLGPEGYGLYSLAVTLVVWLEWTVAMSLARAAIRLVGDGGDWKRIGTQLLQAYLGMSLAVAVLLWATAPSIANLLGEPQLTAPLRLFCVDIPIMVMAFAHQSIVTGLGRFNLRAKAIGVRWIARLGFIVLFVEIGWSITGVVLGTITASIAELLVISRYDRPPIFRRVTLPAHLLRRYLAPLFVLSLCLRLIHQVDLLAVKSLGGTIAAAGAFAGARNLALVSTMFSAAFAPLLLSTLTRLASGGELDHARDIGRDSLRLPLLLLPLVTLTAGAGEEIVRFALGPGFEAAADVLWILVLAGIALTMFMVASSILIAAGRAGLTLAILLPLLAPTLAGHLWAVPRWTGIGAAWVTAAALCSAAVLALAAAAHTWRVAPSPVTAIRAAAMSLVALVAALLWPAAGWWVAVKLATIATVVLGGYWFGGELDERERALVASIVGFHAKRL